MLSDDNVPHSENGAALPEVSGGAAKQTAEPGDGSELFVGFERLPEAGEGTIVRGKVLKVTDSEVLVDIGQKSEGVVPRSEFLAADGTVTVYPGDMIDVQIVSLDENEGTFTISHRKAASLRSWEQIETAFQNQSNIRGRIIERTKGGLIVDVGVRAFLPGSQADLRPLRNLESLAGQEVDCKVIKLNKARNNVVLSRKAALEEDLGQRKAKLLDVLKEGAELTGRVKNVTDYGAFVDLGGMDGLLHITDLAWGRIAHASEVVQVNQEIRVKVLKYDREKGRVSLGLKQLTADPWQHVGAKYQLGQKLPGRVVSVTDYGAFVELEPGVEGLVHVSEMAWSRRMKHPSKVVKVGDMVEVAILDVHSEQRRVSLSLKQTLPDPWTTVAERYAVGMTVEGRIRNLTDFGAFVEIEDGLDALIHVSDLSWDKSVKHPSEILRKGQKVQGQILNLDPARRRISMGLKQLQPDVWEEFSAKTEVGRFVRGKIARLADFGAFVQLEDGIEGLCHSSEIDEDHAAGGPFALAVGNEYEFQVLRLEPADRRISLSLKALSQRSQAAHLSAGAGQSAGAAATIAPAASVPVDSPPTSMAKAEP